jgi:hypothetical protein
MSRLLPAKVTEKIVEQNKRLEREKYIVFVGALLAWHFVGWTYALGALGIAIWFGIADLRRESNLNSMLIQYQLGMLDYLEN